MRNFILTVLLLCGFLSSAQTDHKDEAIKILKELQQEYSKAQDAAAKGRLALRNTDIRELDYETLRNRSIELDEKLKQIINNAETAIAKWLSKGVKLELINSHFKLLDTQTKLSQLNDSSSFELPVSEYLLFGTDNVISINELKDQSTFVLQNLTSGSAKKSKTHFGTFKIPKNKESIIITKIFENVDFDKIDENKIRIDYSHFSLKDKDLENSSTQRKLKRLSNRGRVQFLEENQTLRFKKVDIELNEGSIVDIKAHLIDSLGKVHVFTNNAPISFLNFDKTSAVTYLKHTSNRTDDVTNYEDYVLRVSDIVQYDYTIGGNYVPDDVTFSFPIVTENGISTNETAAASYQLEQSTALNNVIQLRAYTDIFGLGDSEANGLASIEGQAAFFLNTKNVINRNVFLFKRVRPYLSFSRFEDEDRFVALSPTVDDDGNRGINNNLDLLQKSYFSTGLDLDFLTFKFSKESALETALFATARYQASDLDLDGDNGDQYTTVGLGGGVNFHLKRFNNFTLDYSLGWIDYRTEGLNDIDGLSDPSNFLVFENMMELSWFPTGDKSSALFARIKTFDDQSKNSDNHFFQAQVGYRFSLGAGAIVKDK